jgi:outer membrane protein assembly factor BamC
MNVKYSLLMTAVVLSLGACSSVENKRKANGSFDYIEESERVTLLIPEGVDEPEYDRTFDLPELSEEAPREQIGETLEVESPSLVLPLVTGSRIEEGAQKATVWFDQVDDSETLDVTIWNSLINYLEEQGIGIDSFDRDAHKLVTDWILVEEKTGKWYSFSSSERNIGRRFEFSVDMRPHGRTGALEVHLRDYLETIDDDVNDEILPTAKRREEVEILNKVIGYYDYQIRSETARKQRLVLEGLDLELGFNDNGDAAYIVDAPYDVTWARLLLVLRKLGFNVVDLDRSNGLLFANYNGVDSGWWGNLWGGSDSELPIEKDRYRFQIKEAGEKTSITWLSDDNEPLAAKSISDMYLTFSEIMATDDLDI